MQEFLPLLLLILFWSLIGSTSRKLKNANGRTGAKKADPRAADKGKPGEKAADHAPHTTLADAIPAFRNTPDRSLPYTGSLGGFSTEGTDPCHDDPYRMPAGSLPADHPEGTDPCHDDPDRIPAGSLRVDQPEGTDPCHPEARYSDDVPAPQETPGLNLRFTGNEIVRGFVWGEILNRKRA